MLSLGEFTERMDTVLAAKTRGDLNQVLVDLPGIQMRPEYLPQAVPTFPVQPHAGSAPAYPAAGPGGPLVLKGRLSSLTRKGRWDVPSVIRLDTFASSVTLDFTEAVMQTQVVRIEVNDSFSSISIVLPAEATADINGVETVASSATTKVRGGAPFGPLHLVVVGKVFCGNVNVTHPFATRLRKFINGA